MNEGSTGIRSSRCEPSPGVFRARAGAIEDFVAERVRGALADGLAADVTQAVKERLAGQRLALSITGT
jgi:hypothetical protein